MDSGLDCDVIVIGGGPGGSTTATMLARAGWRVRLLEREHFPRDHVGESLLPATMPILEELGVYEAVQAAGFVKKWGATMVWGAEPEPWSWYFRETNERYPHSFQVWRPEFDRILLENSRAHGVDVREGHRVTEVLFQSTKAVGVCYASDTGEEGEARARFVVDASSQNALLGHALKLRRWDPFFKNLAVYGYFKGAARLPEPDDGNILIESQPDGWCWTIPLPDGISSVGVVMDRSVAQEHTGRRALERLYREQVARAPRTSALLADAEMSYGPFVMRDWSYVSDEVVGDGYILVGDAACFVDPLFSSGVHLAMSAGVLAAAYVTSALKDDALAEAAAPVYKALYYTQYGHFHAMAKLFYASNRTADSYFWEARRVLPGAEDFSPRQAFIRAVAGQPPRGYERVVLEHGEPPAGFVEGVRGAERERAERRARVSGAGQRLLDTRPSLALDVEVSVKPVLGEGEFVWGHVVTSQSRPEGTPVSALVAELLRKVDGQRSVHSIAAELYAERPTLPLADVERTAATAAGILYIDGIIEELSGL